MGKDKVKHRKPLLRQFLFSYIMVMVCSIISSFILLTVFYSSYHFFSGKNDDISNPKLANVIEFVSKHGSSIEEEKVKQQLSELLKSNNIDCLVKGKDGTIVFEFENSQYNLNLISRNTSSIEIPVTNEYGKVIYLFVLSYSKTIVWLMLLCVDVGIPFGCFLIYTYIFTRRLNRRISTPLKQLMGSVAKIKEHDLDFSVQYTSQENEIGDLVQALEEMRRELKDSLFAQWRLEQDKRDMVNAITHDIRTPLAIIQGHAEGLQEGMKNDPEKLNSYIEIIEQNSRRVKKLVDDMNTLIEVDSEGFSINPNPVDLHEFMRIKTDDLKVLSNKKGIHLETFVTDNRQNKDFVNIDADSLSQLIDNIVTNSIRFTPQNRKIEIFVVIDECLVSFKICDGGTGFKDKDIPNLFKKFYKSDYSRSIEKGHSGLGLYIAKMIVEKHGGTINASNSAQGGACVEFTIRH